MLRLSALRTRALGHSLYASQRRDFHVFHVVTAGEGRHHFEFESVRLQRGDVFHVRPDQVDWFDEASDHEALLLVFLPEAIGTQSALRQRIANPLRPSADDFTRLEILAELIEDLQRSPALNASTVSLLQAFVGAVDVMHAQLAAASPAAVKTGLCERFESLLAAHHGESRRVGWYATRLGVSQKSLARATHALFGRSPKQHIDRRVTLQAKRRLLHTQAAIEEIAAGLGFSESTNFVKFFRRIEGCTPKAFRQRLLDGPPSPNPGASDSSATPADPQPAHAAVH